MAYLLSLIMSPTASFAQSFVPTPGAISPTTGGTSNYKLQSEVECPTSTINITGYGGNINGWADNHYSPYASTSGGLGNYGVAMGLSIPLGGNLSDFCENYAKNKDMFERTRTQNLLLNSQFTLFKNCQYFSDLGYQLDGEPFKNAVSETGPLSAYKECTNMARFLDPASRQHPTSFPQVPSPEPASTAPMNPPPLNVNVVN
jgi:hypothetical protein